MVGLLWIVGVVFFDQGVSLKSILRIFGLYGGGGWFVALYIGLYIIAPVLNSYIEKTAPRKIAIMLAAFFAFEFLWGNTLSVEFIVDWYSTFSFIGIYILAGLLRKINLRYNNALPYFGIFLAITLINALLYIYAVRCDAIAIRDLLFNYINPFVIAAAACLVLTFAKMKKPPIVYNVLQRSALCFGWPRHASPLICFM